MPALTVDERTAFDATTYPAVGYLYVSQPTLIFEAPLNGVYYNNGAIVALAYGTPTTGTLADIELEMTVEIWANGANLYGSQRLNKTPTSDAIFVGRSPEGTGKGELTYVAGATIRIYDEHRVWAKNPYIDPNTGQQYKDETAYPTDDRAQPPVANAGPDLLIISDTGVEDVELTALGDISTFTVREGTTANIYGWRIADGTVVSGTQASASLTVRFGYGERYVSLTFADSLGANHTCWKYIVVARPSDCIPAKVVRENIRPNGVTLSLEIDASLLPDASRPNAKILYGSDTTHGATGSKQLSFSGWLATEQWKLNEAKKQQKTITIECHDVATRLRSLYGFPLTVSNEDSETGWYRMPDATIDRLIHHYFQWHSNALNVADFSWSGQGATYPLPEFTTSGASLWEQASRLAKAIGYVLTCNTKGQLRILGNPLILPTSDQASEYSLPTSRTSTVVTTLTEADYGKVSFTANQNSPYFWVRSSAVVASDVVGNIDAVRCSAPGNTPAQGTSSLEETELLVTSQEELNVRAGNDYAALKAPQFSQFTFEMVKTKQVFEPADMEWVTIVLPEDARARYPFLSASGNRFLIDEVINSYDHKNMTRKTTLIATIEVEGKPAQTIVEPPQATDTYSGYEWDDYYVEVVPDNIVATQQTGLVAGVGNIVAILNNGYIAVTTDFGTQSWEGSPTWALYDHTATLGTSVLAYSFRATATNVSGWLVTPTKIIYGTNLQSSTPSFTTQKTFGASSNYANIESDYIQAPGLFAIVVRENGSSDVEAHYTTDGGTTWSSAVTIAGFNSGTRFPGIAISTVTAGRAWAGARGTLLLSLSAIYQTSDFGATWSANNDNVDEDGTHAGLIVPFGTNTVAFSGNYDEFFDGTGSVPQETNNISRHAIGSSTTDITPIVSSVRYGPDWLVGAKSISVAENDYNKLAFCGIDFDRTKRGVWVTSTALSSNPVWVNPVPPEVGIPYRQCALVNGGQELYIFGENGNIAYSASPYQTGTFDNRIGNLSTTGEIIGIAGF